MYDIAVAVVSPLRELHDGSRAAGFLADGACIRKEQLLLVPVARLGDREISWLRGQGFRVSDPEPPVSWRVLTQVVRGIAHVALSLRADPVWLSGAAASLVRSLAVWRPFTERFRIAKFVTYADFGLGHIARNIILKESGASVWHYLDAGNMGEALPPINGGPVLADRWGYLYCDVMVCWGERFVRYFQLHHQHVGRYVVVGCLWSEHVRLFREGVVPSGLPRLLRQRGWQPGQKVVSVFPSWYPVDSITSPEDGLAFIRGIERLAGELPGVFIVLKEKHRRWRVSREPGWGGEGVLDAVYQACEELDGRPGWWLPGELADTAEIVAASDLVISFPFTSVTIEAMGAGVKGLYFDPRGKCRGGYYDRIPGLVAYGYEELEERVRCLLYETSEEEYRIYLEKHFKGDIDPFVDGKGLTRFSELLIA